MFSKSQILLMFLLLWAACSKPRNVEFTNQLRSCGQVEEPPQTTTYQVGDAFLRLPEAWQVETTPDYAGLEAADTAALNQSNKVLTFSIHEFKMKGIELLDYFRSEVDLMKTDTTITIIEKGYRAINGNKSYYVITNDTIQAVVLHQLSFYSENKDKAYVIQIGVSDIRYPTRDFCDYLWMVDLIQFQ